MQPNNKIMLFRQSGFSLVEILVGLVISLLATLVIMQVFSAFEGQKRATTGTADAQTNGTIALFNLTRELQVAGYPLMPAKDSALECTTLTFGATGITSISPVTITNGASNASDTITIRYGDGQSGGVFTTIGAIVTNTVTVDSSFGCQVGNTTLVTNGSTCAMSSVTAVGSTTQVTLQNATAAVPGAKLSCLGTWNTVAYTINNNSLNRNGILNTADIVNMQAQYGISTAANSNQITQWVEPSGATWAAPSVTDRNRIKAIRVAIIARNGTMEKNVVSTACSSTTTATPTGLCAWGGSATSPAPTIDLSADANWARYRYRVFETIIPLRNMIWSKETLS